MPKTTLGNILRLTVLYPVHHSHSTCSHSLKVILWLNKSQLNINSKEGHLPRNLPFCSVSRLPRFQVQGCRLPCKTNGRAQPLMWEIYTPKGVELDKVFRQTFSSCQHGQLVCRKLCFATQFKGSHTGLSAFRLNRQVWANGNSQSWLGFRGEAGPPVLLRCVSLEHCFPLL